MRKIKYNKELYFITERIIDDNILVPKIPNNYFTQNGYEDNKIKRVCFGKSVDECLMALSKNCKGLYFYVYTVKNTSEYEVFKPSIIDVPDSKITGELWILTNVKVSYVGKIKCIDSIPNDGYLFKYGHNVARLYDWKYEWIK